MKAAPENSFSYLTAIHRNRVSYPTRMLWEAGEIRGRILDFGCGYGADVRFLSEQRMDVTGYDPHYSPGIVDGLFDTILCQYVLNVLLPDAQEQVLESVQSLLKDEGQAFFCVRRDLKTTGFRLHPIYKKKTYQCHVELPLPSWHRAKHCEIYRLYPNSYIFKQT